MPGWEHGDLHVGDVARTDVPLSFETVQYAPGPVGRRRDRHGVALTADQRGNVKLAVPESVAGTVMVLIPSLSCNPVPEYPVTVPRPCSC